MTNDLENDPRFEGVLLDYFERRRLRGLSNKELVSECAKSESYDDVDTHVEEMMNRLYPHWAGPLSWGEWITFQRLKLKRFIQVMGLIGIKGKRIDEHTR